MWMSSPWLELLEGSGVDDPALLTAGEGGEEWSDACGQNG